MELSKIKLMNLGNNLNPDQKPQQLETLANELRAIAQNAQGDCLALLAILRTLEALHQEIRDTLFLAALPDNRQNLYALLREIESESGWPYIPRMKLQVLLNQWAGELENAKRPIDIVEMPAAKTEETSTHSEQMFPNFLKSSQDETDLKD